MRTDILRLEGEGLLSFREPFEVDFPSAGTVQIDGINMDDLQAESNGSGKSSLLDLISYALYGQICKSNRYAEEVINKRCDKGKVRCVVKVDGTVYSIERGRARSGTTFLKIFDEKGEEKWSESSVTSKQSKLNELFGFNLISFSCATMFGQDLRSFPDLRPTERGQILIEVQNLTRYTDASKISAENAKEAAVNLQNLEKKKAHVEGRLSGQEEMDLEWQIEEWEEHRQERLARQEQKIKDLQAKEKLCSKETQTIIRKRKRILDSWKERAEEQRSVMEKIGASYADLKKEVRAAQEEEKETQRLVITTETKVDAIGVDLRELNELEGFCPTCKQAVADDYLEERRVVLEKIKADLEKDAQEALNLLTITTQRVKKAEARYRQFVDAKEEEAKCAAEIERILRDIEKTEENERLSRIRQDLERVTKALEKIRVEVNPYKALEEERVAKIKVLKKELEEVNRDISKEEEERAFHLFWADGFKRIQITLFEALIDEFEATAQKILSGYSSELAVEFSTNRETKSGNIKDEFHITVFNADGAVSYEMYSGGEKQKVRLAIQLALAQIIEEKGGHSFGFLAFDEPNEGLDSMGKEINFKTFSFLGQDKLVLVTDHDAYFKDYFDQAIRIVKENGNSRIEVE